MASEISKALEHWDSAVSVMYVWKFFKEPNLVNRLEIVGRKGDGGQRWPL